MLYLNRGHWYAIAFACNFLKTSLLAFNEMIGSNWFRRSLDTPNGTPGLVRCHLRFAWTKLEIYVQLLHPNWCLHLTGFFFRLRVESSWLLFLTIFEFNDLAWGVWLGNGKLSFSCWKLLFFFFQKNECFLCSESLWNRSVFFGRFFFCRRNFFK